ncbi:MAG: agmatinase [Woeseiaceae bacterium]|nr:agmatinase [Woeseiaceae bacterium]
MSATSGKVGVLGLGFDANSSFKRGPAEAPPTIRKALSSESANAYSETGFKVWPSDQVVDHGDLDIPDETATRAPIDAIEKGVANALQKTDRLVLLGGDHAVTYPIIRAVAAAHGPISLLHFDAHPDIYPEFEQNPFSHASPMARIVEEGLVDRLVQVGIRSYGPEQAAMLKQHNVDVHPPWSHGPGPALRFDSPLYISFDVDGLDPAFAPGVSHPEPGGLSVRQVLDVIANTKAPRVVGADVVEVNPLVDPTGITSVVAAKLVRELLGRLLSESR